MAISKTWGYSSDKASDSTVTPSSINPLSDFALTEDVATNCSLINNNSALDVGEKLSYQCQNIPNVASGLENVYPPQVKSGVQYVVKLDEQVKLTDSNDATYAEILPVTAYVTIRHPKNGNLAAADIDVIFKRLIGACYKEVNGVVSTRFADMMKSALRPTADGIDPAS
jgi:hypothetical protein